MLDDHFYKRLSHHVLQIPYLCDKSAAQIWNGFCAKFTKTGGVKSGKWKMCAASLPSVCECDLFQNKDETLSPSFFFIWRNSPPPPWAMTSSFTRFLDHTQRRTTVGRTSLDEGSARRRDLYLITHNTHDRQPCSRWDSNPQSQQASGRRPTP